MKKSPRERRLDADYQSVKKLMAESSIFSFESTGATPTRYEFCFRGKGVARDRAGTIHVAEKHEVTIELGASYPRLIPTLAWQSPIFHPHFSSQHFQQRRRLFGRLWHPLGSQPDAQRDVYHVVGHDSLQEF